MSSKWRPFCPGEDESMILTISVSHVATMDLLIEGILVRKFYETKQYPFTVVYGIIVSTVQNI